MKRIIVTLLFALVLGGCAAQVPRSETIRSQHPEWDQATVDKLAARAVEPGMTREMVKAALGSPESVSREGEEEVWGYGYWEDGVSYDRERSYYYVYLKGDRVVRTKGDLNQMLRYG